MINQVIFDLDGTLVDSAPVVAQILNEMRAEEGLASLLIDDFRRLVSLGASTLISSAMNSDSKSLPEYIEAFRCRYRQLETPVSSLYPGASETIRYLVSREIKVGLCSNKPEHLCRQVLNDTKLLAYFSVIVGGDTLDYSKPNPAPLLYAVKTLNGSSSTSVLVGDSSVDHKTALSAHVPFVFYTKGYNDGVDRNSVDYSISDLSQLLDLDAIKRHRPDEIAEL